MVEKQTYTNMEESVLLQVTVAQQNGGSTSKAYSAFTTLLYNIAKMNLFGVNIFILNINFSVTNSLAL